MVLGRGSVTQTLRKLLPWASHVAGDWLGRKRIPKRNGPSWFQPQRTYGWPALVADGKSAPATAPCSKRSHQSIRPLATIHSVDCPVTDAMWSKSES